MIWFVNRKSIPSLSSPDVHANTTLSTLSHVMRWQDILRDLTRLLKLVEAPGDPFRRNYCRGDERSWVYQLASHGTLSHVVWRWKKGNSKWQRWRMLSLYLRCSWEDETGLDEMWRDERRLKALDTKVFYFSQFSLIFFPWQPRQEKHRKLLRFIIEFSSSSPRRLRFCQSPAKSAVISSIY